MKCIIIEDQPPAQRILKKFIHDSGHLELIDTFSDAVEALAFLKKHKVDLIFLDIHLPKISGIDFLKSIINPPPVILTTAFGEYALESYDLDVVDYLLKPFSFARFLKAVSKVQSILDKRERSMDPEQGQKEIFIKSGYELVKIVLEDIFYIKSDADYTEIYSTDNKKLLSSESLRKWEARLDATRFVRVHKSYIVNVTKIEKIIKNQVKLFNHTMIPIGRTYKDSFLSKFVKD